jgi:hypothetical protein
LHLQTIQIPLIERKGLFPKVTNIADGAEGPAMTPAVRVDRIRDRTKVLGWLVIARLSTKRSGRGARSVQAVVIEHGELLTLGTYGSIAEGLYALTWHALSPAEKATWKRNEARYLAGAWR